MNRWPLLPPGRDDDVVAWQHGCAVTCAEFLRDVADLAARLPDCRYVLNHCDDRYHFMVGLAASLVRGQVTLLPPSRAPHALDRLRRDYVSLYCLTDQADETDADTLHYQRPAADALLSCDPLDLRFPAQQMAVHAFTSGSTGDPRAHTHTWGGLMHEVTIARERLALSTAAGGCVVATVPPQHMYGLVYSVLLPMQAGYAVEAARPFYPQDVRCVLEAHAGPTVLVTTPVHIRACVLDETRLPPLALLLSSTGPLEAALALRAERDFHTRVMEFFGSTETGAIAARRQAEGPAWHSFNGVHVSDGVRGLRVTAAHLAGPVDLGDAVEVLNERQFVLHGRHSDTVKIAGKRMSLGELNRHLLAVDGVRDGAFFLPDTDAGCQPRLTAFVVAPGKTRGEILDSLRVRIDPVFLPRPLRLVEALPRNDNGKLPRSDLARLLAEVEAHDAVPPAASM